MSRKTATSEVLKHLKHKKSINQLQCLEKTGSWRLSSIIFNLRAQGYIIESKQVKVTTRYGAITYVSKYIYKGKKNNAYK